MKQYESVVIGAGPGGLTAALYLSRFGVSTALVEKLAPGGQLLNTFEIANYLGFPEGMAGWSLAEAFAQHLEGHELDRYSQAVHSITIHGNRHRIVLDSEVLETKTIIICSGASPKKLGLPREGELTGRGISYCAMCDGPLFRNKVVAMVGGGNSALEEALHLSNIVKKVYIIHRRNHFRADKVHQIKVAERPDKIEPVLNQNVVSLEGDTNLTGVVVEPASGGPKRLLEVDGLFVFIGINPSGHFLPPELEVDPDGFIITDTEMRTCIPGLFAAGDIRSKQCRQVATAVGDGATAAYAAFSYLETLLD